MKKTTRRLNTRAMALALTARLKDHNNSQPRLSKKIRGNTEMIVERLLLDLCKAHNHGRKEIPCAHIDKDGAMWLITSPYSLRQIKANSMTVETVNNCLFRLKAQGFIAKYGAAGDLLPELDQRFFNTAVLLDPKMLIYQEAKTPPQEPPEKQGGHIDGGITNSQLQRLKRKFTVK